MDGGGEYEKYIAEFKIGADFSNNGGALAGPAYGYAMTGRKDEALKIIDELINRSGASHDLPWSRGCAVGQSTAKAEKSNP